MTDFVEWIAGVAVEHGWRAWLVPLPVHPISPTGQPPSGSNAFRLVLALLHDDPPLLAFADVHDSDIPGDAREFLVLADKVATDVREYVYEAGSGQPPLGVFVWRPGDEEQVETILRSKVLT